MQPRDWFGLAVRLTGLWCLLQAATYGISYFDAHLALQSQPFAGTTYNNSYLVFTLGYAALAAATLLCADAFVAVTYGPRHGHREFQDVPQAEEASPYDPPNA